MFNFFPHFIGRVNLIAYQLIVDRFATLV